MPNRRVNKTSRNPNQLPEGASRVSALPGGAMSNIVMAEMLLLQAVVESAAVISDGLDELGEQLSRKEPTQRSVSDVIVRTASAALEPYVTRLQFLQELQDLQEPKELH